MNKTCKDCIHYDVCGYADDEQCLALEDDCSHFKDISRYIELPCAVGDTVWFDTYKKNGTVSLGIQPHKVDRIDVVIVTDTKSLIETQTYSWEIGKRVFLTKEEAEQVLQVYTSRELDYVEAKDLDKDSPEFKEALESFNRL